MTSIFDSSRANAAGDSASLADQIERTAETIRACDRLCLLSSWSVCQSVIELDSPPPDANGKKPLAFIPSISRKLQNLNVPAELLASGTGARKHIPASGEGRHPTTSAQCMAALQTILPVIGRFRLGTQETKGLAFHPIDRSSMDVFEPKHLNGEIRTTIDRGLRALIGPPPGGGSVKHPGISVSNTFGHLHPFTAAQVLRAVAPSHGMYQRVWWESLLIVLWFLNRRIGSLSGPPNIDATGSPSTAFLTHKCVEAIERVLLVFQRRRDRFRELLKCLQDLDDVSTTKAKVEELGRSKLLSAGIFTPGYRYRAENLIRRIIEYIDELECDTALPCLQEKWKKELGKITSSSDYLDHASESPKEFLFSVVETFALAVNDAEVKTEAANIREAARQSIGEAIDMEKEVERVHGAVRAAKVEAIDLDKFPKWICSADYWTSTRNILDGTQTYSKEVMATLERHWLRNRQSSLGAKETLEAFSGYLTDILDGYERVAAGGKGQNPLDNFLATFFQTAEHINSLRSQLLRAVDTGAKWADVLMNRHLSFSTCNEMAQFDPSELAHAVRVVCGAGTDIRFEIILQALRAVCAAQRPDGTWACQQPFFWSDTGSAAATLSVEIAWAVVSTINVLYGDPERFGASREQLSGELRPVFEAIGKFFRWLSVNIQSFELPPALGKKDLSKKRRLFGWSSDRVSEPGRIHSWVTANTIEFLVEYRRMLQESINLQLRTEFQSYHPGELKKLTSVEPTDLANRGKGPYGEPVISQLLSALRPHKVLDIAEGPWMPKAPKAPRISFWSGILYGPPGTSKTFLAKAIAAELDWPLVSLSPSDFLAYGEQRIESRSREIFSSLTAGSRLVFFFDEVDELIRDRAKMDEKERSVFSFLTPSFLTKLQDFRDAAEKNEFIFIIGTNYFERIDSAAKRTGRIDRSLPVVYSDLPSRGLVIFEYLLDKLDPKKGDKTIEKIEKLRSSLGKAKIDRSEIKLEHRLEALEQYLNDLDKAALSRECTDGVSNGKAGFLNVFAQFSGLLSYPNLRKLCARLEELTLEQDPANGIETIKSEMRSIRNGHSDQFRPEIRLIDYVDRYQALEEIVRVAKIIPEMKVAWLTEHSDCSEYALDLSKQKHVLMDALKSSHLTPKYFKIYVKDFNKRLGAP